MGLYLEWLLSWDAVFYRFDDLLLEFFIFVVKASFDLSSDPGTEKTDLVTFGKGQNLV
jgi:hypothetical protein